MTQTVTLSRTLLEHAAAILRMKSCGLSLDWLKACRTRPCRRS